jgi:protocatechuate 3,4-dioxygenase beta subunit
VLFAVSLAAQAGELTMSSVVLDSQKRPIQGASIEIERLPSAFEEARAQLENKRPSPVSKAVSDRLGRFRVSVPEPGIWRLRIRARGFISAEALEFLPVAEPVQLAAVELWPETMLMARVVGDQGKPVPARLQTLSSGWDSGDTGRGGYAPWPAPYSAQTDSGGTVSIPRIGRETIHLSAIADGYLETVTKNLKDESVTVRLIHGCRRALEVVEPEGQPAAEALVQAGHWSLGKTDAGGRAEITAPCQGTLKLQILTADGRRVWETLPEGREGEPLEIRFELPPQPPKLTGRVLEKGSQKPLAGVLVWPADDPGSFTSTDGQGRYAVREPAQRDSPLMATADGVVFDRDDLVAFGPPRSVPADGSHAGPAFYLSRAASVNGTVADAAGHPVEGAEVRVAANFARFSTRSDERGTFRLRFPGVEDSFEIVASHRDFLPATLRLGAVPAHQGRELKIVLQRGQEAVGRILDDQNLPVARAEGFLFIQEELDRGELSPLHFSSSNVQGNLSFWALQPGRYTLQVRLPGRPLLSVPGLDVREAGEAANFGTLHLPPVGLVEGRVVDLQNHPIAGARVYRDSRDYWGLESQVWIGADGRFVLACARGSRSGLTISAPGYANGFLNVEAPTLSPATVTLKPSGLKPAHRILISLRNEKGEPVSKATLQVQTERMKNLPSPTEDGWSSWPQRSEDGQFETQSEPGNSILTVSADGYLPQEVKFAVPEDGDSQNLEIVLQTGPAAIVGQVTGLGGEPIANVSVQVYAKDQGSGTPQSQRSSYAWTDSNGRFRADSLTEGIWSVFVQPLGYRMENKKLELHTGENRLDLQLNRGPEVEGRAVDSAGQPVPQASLSLRSAAGTVNSGNSDDEGHFLLRGLEPGLYRLQAMRRGYAVSEPIEVSLDLGRSVRGLEILLHPGGTLHGRILGLTAKELAEVKISARNPPEQSGTITVDARGEYQIRGLAPGEWKVSAEVAHRRAEATAILLEGESEATLDLEMHPGVTLSGQVFRKGEPVDPISVWVLDGPPTAAGGNVLGNAGGEFRLEGLDPGVYKLRISDGIQWTLLHTQQVELRHDQYLHIELPANRVTVRTVTGSGSQPVPWAHVSLFRALAAGDKYPENAASAGTDAQGNLTLQNLPTGSYSVTVEKEGYESAKTTLQVEDGGEAEAQLVLKPSNSPRP